LRDASSDRLKHYDIIAKHHFTKRSQQMSEEEKLKIYLHKLQVLSLEKVKDKKLSAIKALKESLNYIEGEMVGY